MPGSPKWYISLRFPHKNPTSESPVPHTPYMPQPSNSSQLVTPTILCEEYRSLGSSTPKLFHSLVISFHLDPNILPNTLSNTLSLRSSLNVSDHVSHSYEATGKIIVLFITIFKFLDSKPEDKIFCTEWCQVLILSDFNMLLIPSWTEFWFVEVVHTYLNFLPFQRTIINLHTVTSSCFLMSRYDHMFSYINFQSPYWKK